MEERTQQNEQIETIDISPTLETSDVVSTVETDTNSFRNPIIFRDTVPTLPNPKTFKEQFYLYKNGSTYKFYVNIDGTWKEVTLV